MTVLNEIVWCHFPENKGIEPGPKPRPALIVKVFDDQAPHFIALVAYGTSQKTDHIRSGEFLIADREVAAYQLAGLRAPTRCLIASVPTDTVFDYYPKRSFRECIAATSATTHQRLARIHRINST